MVFNLFLSTTYITWVLRDSMLKSYLKFKNIQFESLLVQSAEGEHYCNHDFQQVITQIYTNECRQKKAN